MASDEGRARRSVPRRQRDRGRSPETAADCSGQAGGPRGAGVDGYESPPLHILFALPPNVDGYGEMRIPAGVLVLGSLAEQAGCTTDFVLAVSPGTRRTCPSELLLEPDPDRSPVDALGRFTRELIERIEACQAAGRRTALALSCFSSFLYLPTMLAAVCVRERFPELPILVGGYHPTIDPASMIERVGTEAGPAPRSRRWQDDPGRFVIRARTATVAVLARQDSVFDHLFRGRSERSFLGVLDELRSGAGRSEAPRVHEADGFDDGELRRFRYSPAVVARMAGPPDALVSAGLNRRFDLCFSFGCPHSCAFCVNSTRHEPWQGMEVEAAIEVLERLHLDHRVDQLSVLDANFAADRGWRRRFFESLAEQPWAGEVQLDIQASVSTFELPDLALFDRIGLTVQVGVESCSDEILLRMGKTRDPDEYRGKLRRLVERMAPRVDMIGLLLIFGYPGETRETLRESLERLVGECRALDYPNVAILPQLYLPLLGTEAANRTAEYRLELGFEPPSSAWWLGDSTRRFDGMRPSRELDLDTCCKLAALVADYYFGDGVGRPASSTAPGEPPALRVKTKLEKRRFLASFRALLTEPS